MAMLEKINHFVDVCLDNQSIFEQMKQEIDRRDQEIQGCVERFRQDVGQALSAAGETDDPELRQFCENVQNHLKHTLETVAEQMESTRKGMEFIKKYEQSFNVAVFGKVKAGKSYLGNFIMGNRFRQMGLDTHYNKLVAPPKVEVYDRGKVETRDRLEELDPENFYVNATEATSTIQLFHLGALAWFDTPGIGSVTWENEMLAKEYVDNADLVVYTCNSDAAGTQQDFKEMVELYRKGKPFLLLLTQSDTVEEDWDDELEDVVKKWAPKSREDRQAQETYIRNETRQQGIQLKSNEVMAISALLAMEALESADEALFDASHMGDFLDVLVSITENEGADYKRRTPAKRMNQAIDEISAQLHKTGETLQAFGKDLAARERKMTRESDQLMESMKLECSRRVDELLSREAGKVSSENGGIDGAALSEAISKMVYEVLLKNCVGAFANSGEILSNYEESLRISGVDGLRVKKDSFQYEVKVVQTVERDPHGFFEHIGSLFGKSYYTSQIGTETKTMEIDLGVDTRQAAGQAKAQLNDLFQREVPGMMAKIGERYLAEAQKLLQHASRCIQKTAAELQSLRMPC